METWLELARGPIFQFALIFMILGLLRHIALATVNTGIAIWRAGDKKFPVKAMAKATLDWLIPARKLKGSIGFSLLSIVMHVGLIVVPIFLFSHVALWERGLGISWPAIGMGAADVLTLVTIAALFAILAIRIFGRDARAISGFQDYAILVLLAVPFISGYLAMHPAINPFDYSGAMLIHVLSADLILILIPITKLSHVVLMPATQVIAEVGWHFPATSGENVCVALHKEEEPI